MAEEETFRCGICDYDCSIKDRRYVFTEYPEAGSMCEECLVDHFHNAYNQTSDPDLDWGLRWGVKYVSAREHTSTLGADFVAKYEALEAEYQVPRRKRVYCPHPAPDDGTTATCNTFVAEAKSDGEEGTDELRCPACDRWVCLICRKSARDNHPPCSGPAQPQETVSSMPGMRVRGVEVQDCPKCEYRIAHLDQCNFVRCPILHCGTGFCFICGQSARHKYPYEHWQERQPDGSRGCPLWGGKGPNDPIKTMHPPPWYMLQPEIKFWSLDMPTLKLNLGRILTKVDRELTYPPWIKGLSDDWNVVFRYENGVPKSIAQYYPKSHRPETTFEEMRQLEALTLYLNYLGRCFKMLELVNDVTPQKLVQVDEPASMWAPYLTDIYDNVSLAERRMAQLQKTSISEFFLFWENASGSMVDIAASRHAPRGLQIYFWIGKPDPLKPLTTNARWSVIFAGLALDPDPEDPQRDFFAEEALVGTEIMLLSSPHALLLAVDLMAATKRNTDLLPPRPSGRTDDYYIHVTADLNHIMVLVSYFHGVPWEAPDGTLVPQPPLPACWQDLDMPREGTQIIIRYLRDGQATEMFDQVGIAGVYLDSRTSQKIYDLLSEFCRYMKDQQEKYQLLQSLLIKTDVNLFTSHLKEAEATTHRSQRYRVFTGWKVMRRLARANEEGGEPEEET